jgi:hypothetical protein
MAQISAQLSFKDAQIKLSTTSGSSAQVDISGYANAWKVSGGDRDSKDTDTFSGDTPVVTIGKRKGLDITVTALYTSGSATGNPYQTIETAYQNGTQVYLTCAPQGLTSGSSGTDLYTAQPGYVLNAPYVSGVAGSADAVAFDFKVHVPYITRSACP